MIRFARNIAKSIAKKSDLLDSRLEDLVSVTTPNNNKILLDISLKLYDDEVSRYRWLEEKSMRIFTIIAFVLGTVPAATYWVLVNYQETHNICFLISAMAAITLIIVALFNIVTSIKTTNKHSIVLTEENLKDAEDSYFTANDFYKALLIKSKYAVDQYREANLKKSKKVNRAHYCLLLLLISIIVMIIVFSILIFTK